MAEDGRWERVSRSLFCVDLVTRLCGGKKKIDVVLFLGLGVGLCPLGILYGRPRCRQRGAAISPATLSLSLPLLSVATQVLPSLMYTNIVVTPKGVRHRKLHKLNFYFM